MLLELTTGSHDWISRRQQIIRGQERPAAVDDLARVGCKLMTSQTTSWYVRKPYLHFDLPLSKVNAVKYVSDPKRVARHPFYPLLSYSLITPRIKKYPAGSPKSFVKEPKERPIAYPAHKDGYIFAYYRFLLETPYENWLTDNRLEWSVTAFRRGVGNNITLSKTAFDFIKETPDCEIIATDVESFFDNIKHEHLKAVWARFIDCKRLPDDHYAVYRAITQYGIVERHKACNLFGIPIFARSTRVNQPSRLCTPKQFRDKVVPRGLIKPNPGLAEGIGIPQGTQLSPLLSNMYMAALDLAMNEWVTEIGGRYWRYCDDILMVMPPKHGDEALSRLDEELQRLSLNRSKPKTQILNGGDLSQRRQLQYLGFMFNGTDAVIRPSSIHRYHRKLKKAVRAAEIRRTRESRDNEPPAPFRQQALYNMYSELPTRGKKARARKSRQKFSGNFISYMGKAGDLLASARIKRQQRKVLKHLRASLKRHAG